jgi:NAD(P)-dependent dehydrogenase (short-subunit alcohol dehydrogenase family)
LTHYLAVNRTDVFIFAGVRVPSEARDLRALQDKYPEKVCIVQNDAADTESSKIGAKIVEERFGWIDVVIGNAGMFTIAWVFIIVIYLMPKNGI